MTGQVNLGSTVSPRRESLLLLHVLPRLLQNSCRSPALTNRQLGTWLREEWFCPLFKNIPKKGFR
jgi:hypothetical protein